jgi:putative endonuclease
MKTYWVYMLLCVDGTYYVGVTNDLDRRLWEHNEGIHRRAYTHDRRPLILAHCSAFGDIGEAIAWEKRLKSWSHAKKGALARNDWPALREIVRFERRRRASRGPSTPLGPSTAPTRLPRVTLGDGFARDDSGAVLRSG